MFISAAMPITAFDPKRKFDLPLLCADTVEKLDFLPRSQFLRQQAGFKKKALRVRQKADFSVRGGPSELAMATRGAICPA